MQIIMPMAGRGDRMKALSQNKPKPLIEVKGKPIYRWSADSLGVNGDWIFLVLKEHYDQISESLKTFHSLYQVISVDSVTEGQACTVLLAERFIKKEPLLILNCDQYVSWDSKCFIDKINKHQADGGIVTFENSDPKWSYAKNNSDGYVSQVAEKNPISNEATIGIYYFKNGLDFVQYAHKMIDMEDRTNGEFYVCPVFNHMIDDGARIVTYKIQQPWGLGTAKDVEYFEKKFGL